MSTFTNLDLIIQICNYLAGELQKKGLSYPVYAVAYPKDKADRFFLVAPVAFDDEGRRSIDSVVEVSAYAKNLSQSADQTQPDLEAINEMTRIIQPLLLDAIIQNTSIISIRPTLVSDPDIRYFYNSIVCEVFSVKTNK